MAANKQISQDEVKECVGAGRWFPRDKETLSKQIDEYFGKTSSFKTKGKLLALISPHAGYIYSGPIAAYGYNQLKGQHFDTVIVIGPSHYVAVSGASVYPKGYYRTPLGTMEIDSELANQLMSELPQVKYVPEAFSREHSVENQFPFLQRALPSFKLLPIITGIHSIEFNKILGQTIAKLIKNKNVLLVASSDMSHYLPYNDAVKIDNYVLKILKENKPEKLDDLFSKDIEGGGMCGKDAVEIIMFAAKVLGADKIEILKYANSGDTTGDKIRVVGYASVGFFNSKQTKKNNESILKEKTNNPTINNSDNNEETLPPEDKKQLLKIAREAMEYYIRTGRKKEFKETKPSLTVGRGVFVTFKKQDMLRGCMGYFKNDKPLFKAVADQAIVAASQDPRFPPISTKEFSEVDIEISVLSVPQPVDSYKKIIVGKHGVILRKDFYSATFLPQVAPEQGWTRDEMLEHLSMKAGLSDNAWREDAQFEVYTADVFGEKE